MNVFKKKPSEKASHTFLIKRQHVELESTGLLADITVNVLRSRLMDSDGVLQGLHAGLQAERVLGVTYRVPGERQQKRLPGTRES